MSVELRHCGLQGWAFCDGNCGNCGTTATTTTDGYWYHGNGKLGGEFHPTKPNGEERYGEYVKVKHGRWSEKHYCSNLTGYDYAVICSECEKPTYRQFAEPTPNYCPNCGAKMDEVELTTSAELHPEKYLKNLNEVKE